MQAKEGEKSPGMKQNLKHDHSLQCQTLCRERWEGFSKCEKCHFQQIDVENVKRKSSSFPSIFPEIILQRNEEFQRHGYEFQRDAEQRLIAGFKPCNLLIIGFLSSESGALTLPQSVWLGQRSTT